MTTALLIVLAAVLGFLLLEVRRDSLRIEILAERIEILRRQLDDVTDATFGEGPTPGARAGAAEAQLHHRRPLERDLLERRRFCRLELVDKKGEV